MASLASLYISRMLGLFMVLPVLVVLGADYQGATPALLGLALGIYGLTQALLQIPLGLLSDFLGRKPVIIAGLLVFAAGSVIAAVADNITWLIIGRALQGAGAIAAAVMALLTDLTSDQNRTNAMASLGASIGVAFALSLVLGPVIAAHWGLAGIFWLTAGLAVVGILVAAFVVPPQPRNSVHESTGSAGSRLRTVLTNRQLQRLDVGVFCLHLLMTALFVAVPGVLVQAQLPVAKHWLVYLPVMVVAFVAMVPLIIIAEKRRKTKPVLLTAVLSLALSFLALVFAGKSLVPVVLLLLLFFWGFNLLEATLPSLMSKTAPVGTKGAASGVYSTCQFMGAFAGGVLGGWLLENFDAQSVFMMGACLAGLWWLLSLSMAEPKATSQVLVTLDGRAFEQVVEPLKNLEGVLEVTHLQDLKAASLRVYSDQFERASLQELGLQ